MHNFKPGFVPNLQRDVLARLIVDIRNFRLKEQLPEGIVKDAFIRFSTNTGDVSDLKEYTRKGAHSTEIENVHQQRAEAFTSFRMGIESKSRSHQASEKGAGLRLLAWFTEQSDLLNKTSIASRTRFIHNLDHALKQDNTVMEALQEMKMVDSFQFMVTLSNKILSYQQKQGHLKKSKKGWVPSIKKNVYFELKLFLSILDSAILMENNPQGEYAGYGRCISGILDNYNVIYRAAKTARKNAKEKESGADSPVVSGSTSES